MGTPAQIASGLATRLATISGLETSSSRPRTLLPTHGWCELSGDGGLVTFAGDLADYTYDVVVVVPGQKGRQFSESLLLPYLARSGSQSVYAAVMADPTLGGAADGIRNWTLVEVGTMEVGDVERYGARWRAEVMA